MFPIKFYSWVRTLSARGPLNGIHLQLQQASTLFPLPEPLSSIARIYASKLSCSRQLDWWYWQILVYTAVFYLLDLWIFASGNLFALWLRIISCFNSLGFLKVTCFAIKPTLFSSLAVSSCQCRTELAAPLILIDSSRTTVQINFRLLFWYCGALN